MGLLFSAQKREHNIAIFDIGSGSVGGAIVSIPQNKDGVPTILKSARTDIKFQQNINPSFDSFMNEMIVALGKTASLLYQTKIGAPDEIYCVVASPWYLSETRTIKMSREKSFILTKRLATDLIQKEVSSLTELYKNKYDNSENLPEVIEQHTMAVSLNGYNVNDPLGRRCKLLEMNMVISLVPQLCTKKIKEELFKTFHHTNINFSSFTLDTYLAVRDKYITQDSYLLLDISGEITDVGIVTKGILKSVISFPFGRKTLYQQICSKLKIELRDALEIFKLYNDGTISSELRKKVEPIFKSIESSWDQAFKQCIKTLPRTLVLPNVIFLTADNDINNWFTNVLRKEEYVQSVVPDNKCVVITLKAPDFFNACQVKDEKPDPFLMIETIAIMRKIFK